MELTEFFLAELDREVERSRRALEQVPEGKHDWKPHEKSMIFGYLDRHGRDDPDVDRDDRQAGRARHRAEGRAARRTAAEEHERGIPRRRWTSPPPTRAPR